MRLECACWAMAKSTLNSALTGLSGSIDHWVYRQTPHGTVITRRPDMSGVVWSPAQLAQRERARAAGCHYRRIMADPRVATQKRAEAKAAGLPVSVYVMKDWLVARGPEAPGA
jgi:hypothetical protein